MATTRYNTLDPVIDIQGTIPVSNTRGLPTDEANFLGAQTSTGTGDAISAPAAGLQTITDAAGLFVATDVGQFITISGSSGGLNDGTFLVTARPGATQLTYLASPTGAAEPAYGGTWVVRNPYTIADDINFERTDRKNIKGTAQHYTDVPTYTTPDAPSTPKPANLTNVAGKTTDAKPIVRDVLQANIALRPPINYTDGSVASGSNVFTTTGYHFVAGDLNSFITLVCAGDPTVNGTYRVSTVTDGKTLVLDGLNPAVGGPFAATWTLEGGLKGILSSRTYAKATDHTGIPIGDAGAYDQTNYDATYVEMVDPVTGIHPVTNAALALFARSYGNDKDPKRTATNDGVRFFVQLLTGINDGTATNAVLQMLSGRTGAVATVVGGDKVIGGLTGVTADDVGRWITVYNCGTVANCGIYQISAADELNQRVTVTRTGNFSADANTGTLLWGISDEGSAWNFYNGDRWTLDDLDETAFRTTMVSGIITDAALTAAIHNLQLYTGAHPGEQHPALLNTGNYYVFSDIPGGVSDTTLLEIVQTINDQIGNRTYTGSGPLAPHDGETITESLQRLSDAISASTVVRTIERLTAGGIVKFTVHDLPVATGPYTPSADGANLWVFWRGLLRDPGTVANGDDYQETSGSGGAGGAGQITPYTTINQHDHINYFILQ